MSPTLCYILRAALVGVVAAAASLQANPDVIQAILAGIVGLGLYAGVGAATPLEPKVGKKS